MKSWKLLARMLWRKGGLVIRN